MNRDKTVKMGIIIIIILAIILAIVFIFSVVNAGKGNGKVIDKIFSQKIDVAESCTFDVPLRDFNRLANNVSAIKLCGGYNKLIINDVSLNNEKVNLYVIYFNGPLETENKNLGIYLDDKLISSGASFDERNVIRIYNNMFFVKKEGIDNTNILVYGSNGKLKYDLAYALNKIILEDPVFKDSGLKKTRVTIENIDVNSYLFDEGEFIFETTSDCKSTQEYKGSKYKVIFDEKKFKNPSFVEKISC